VERGVTKKSRKKGKAVSTKDLPFLEKETKISNKNKKVKKGGPVSSGLRPILSAYKNYFSLFFFLLSRRT
jgi:hypothetical protein